jgi:uncharacterized protein YbjT (DUF2867 family)
MQALVVGATGELGTALVRALSASGHSVRALVRPGAHATHLMGNSVVLVQGDLSTGPSRTAQPVRA